MNAKVIMIVEVAEEVEEVEAHGGTLYARKMPALSLMVQELMSVHMTRTAQEFTQEIHMGFARSQSALK